MKFKVTRTFEIEGCEGIYCNSCGFGDRNDMSCAAFDGYLAHRIMGSYVVLYRCEECLQAEKEWKERGNETQTLD